MIAIYRVQDASGRGPWRPGFSHRWIDEVDRDLPPPVQVDFGPEIFRRIAQNEHCGCGVEDVRRLSAWFTESECLKLNGLGFNLVRMPVARIVARSAYQVVFARRAPLNRGCVILPWGAIAWPKEDAA